MKFSYPAIFYPEDDGRYSVIFPDLNELATYGDNRADALALTFAYPVLSRKQEHEYNWTVGKKQDNEYDPFHGMW